MLVEKQMSKTQFRKAWCNKFWSVVLPILHFLQYYILCLLSFLLHSIHLL